MPEFDLSNTRSAELRLAKHLRDRLSECASFQFLTEAEDAAEALGSIVVGPGAPPGDGQVHTVAELDNKHAWALIVPQEEEGTAWFEDDAAEESQLRFQIDYVIDLRYRPREFDVNSYGEANQFNLFWDVLSALPEELRAAVRGNDRHCPRIRGARRMGIAYGELSEENSRGYQLYGMLAVTVGDLGE